MNTKQQMTLDEVQEQRYPDLAADIALLKRRANEVGEHRRSLIDKWLTSLTTLQKEMRHLERLEKFSGSLATDANKDE